MKIYANINAPAAYCSPFNKQSNYATAEVSDNITRPLKTLNCNTPASRSTSLMDQGDLHLYGGTGRYIKPADGRRAAVIILFLFLRDLRPTFITLVSIPISVVFAFCG